MQPAQLCFDSGTNAISFDIAKQIIILKYQTMKIQISYLSIISLLIFLFTGNSFGQAGFKKSAGSTFLYGDILANPSGDGSLIESRVSKPALNAFSSSFQNTSNIKWYRLGDKYEVQFVKNENQHKALFNSKGRRIYTICYGKEKDLPVVVRKMVKREYVEYNILCAIEVNEENRNIWVINLEDDTHLITARVENNIIEETGYYSKPKTYK